MTGDADLRNALVALQHTGQGQTSFSIKQKPKRVRPCYGQRFNTALIERVLKGIPNEREIPAAHVARQARIGRRAQTSIMARTPSEAVNLFAPGHDNLV